MDIALRPEATSSTTDISAGGGGSSSRAGHGGAAPNRSFREFYGSSAGSVTGALTATLGDAELAADAMAEAMARAWQRWDKIARYDKPEAWVYRVAMNWALSWKRRRRRERDRPVPLGADRVEHDPRDDSLDAALAELSVEHRAVIVCRVYLDWSVAASAEALGIAPGTVKSRLARALAELRRHAEPGSQNSRPSEEKP